MATNWFDLYKTLECFIAKFGAGKEKSFLDLNWADENEIEQFKRTANWVVRHGINISHPMTPMRIEVGRELIVKRLRRAFAEAQSHPTN